jgi:zeta-carotene desaturase
MTAKVLVLGAGPAGLSAAARLLERGQGRVRVHVVHMQDVLGGKAASWRDPQGFLVEHGWHMLVGFYDQLFGLMERAGIDRDDALTTMYGDSHCYEPADERVYTMNSRGGKLAVAARFAFYDGLPIEDRFHFARVMTQAFAIAGSGQDLTRHDDICFDTWAVELGLRPHMTRYSMFRFLRIAYFNFPEQISAYHVLQTLKNVSTSDHAELHVCQTGTTEALWNPIGAYVARLGGTFESRVVATDWIYEGDRIVGVRAAKAHETGPLAPRSGSEIDALPVIPGTERTLDDFDYVLSTLPVAVLQQMNREDKRMWGSSFFRRLLNLRSAATMALTVVTRNPVAGDYRGPVHGLPAPFSFVVDMKPYWREFSGDPTVGSVLVFGGQERGFEDWSDEQVISFTLANYTPVLGSPLSLGILKVELHRNRHAWERLLLAEPGVEPFRPDPITPFRNLFLAGDWVRNRVNIISMEGAVTSGIEAADLLLSRIGGGP